MNIINGRDYGCADITVCLHESVTITNPARDTHGEPGIVKRIESPSRFTHGGYILIETDREEHWYCTCELNGGHEPKPDVII